MRYTFKIVAEVDLPFGTKQVAIPVSIEARDHTVAAARLGEVIGSLVSLETRLAERLADLDDRLETVETLDAHY